MNGSSAGSQKVISSFFLPAPSGSPKLLPSKKGKRSAASSVVDLTLDSDNDLDVIPVPKRLKRSHPSVTVKEERIFVPDFCNPLNEVSREAGPSRANTTPPPRVKNHGKSVQKYRFNKTPDSQGATVIAPESLEENRVKNARIEAFKRKLLGENNLFNKKAQGAVEETTVLDDTMDVDGQEKEVCEDDESGLEDNDQNISAFPEFISSKVFSGGKGKGKGYSLRKSEEKYKRKEVDEVGPSGQTYTPLEKQIKALKHKYPDTLLMAEVGYKYRFFGEDAKIASDLLSIVCFTDRNFLTAGIPTHRRDIHLKKLLSQGLKVGIIGQMETAALKKASDNRNAPFVRGLTHLYTAATYVDEVDSVDDASLVMPGQSPMLVCITEELLGGMGADEKVKFGFVAVCPSTADVVWDEFDDGFMRNELETRMAHIKPSELLLPKKMLSSATERLLHHFIKDAPTMTHVRDRIRIERYTSDYSYSESFQELQKFYSQKATQKSSENFKTGNLLAKCSHLPRRVVIALAHCVNYLKSFGLAEVLTQTEFFNKFTERQHMLLNANTLANLEIYRNQTDFTSKGSLMWILDKTKTAFGARLLRSWVGRPLVDVEALQARVNAVEEIILADSAVTRERIMKLCELLKGLPDLAKGLSRIQYGKCTPKELSLLLKAFRKIADAFDVFESLEDVGFGSAVLNEIVFTLPQLRASLKQILVDIDLKKAADDRRDELWTDPDKYPEVDGTKFAIMTIESELVDQLKIIRKVLHKPAAQWTSVAGEDYLIEIKKNEKREIPVSWHLVSSTKSARRYRTPEVRKKLQELAQYQETLALEANKAYLAFLSEIMDQQYGLLRNVVNKLAIADCLLSLASVASQEGYVKPAFVSDDVLEILDGRHPMVEALRIDPFVPNNLCLGGMESRTKIITGPNMGGKSSAVRMVAIIALMAQIGCYCPAASIRMGLLDAILTRMGASDDLARGRSTFMMEMSETSDILHCATKKSLVILDELGRGSSTFDGMAIAGAVLEHLIKTKQSKTLFITHYPLVAMNAVCRFPGEVDNIHMGFTEDTDIDGKRIITFLYRLTEGISSGSYGIECARLAGIPEPLLGIAAEQRDHLQATVESRSQINRIRKACNIVRDLETCQIKHRGCFLKDLRTLAESSSNPDFPHSQAPKRTLDINTTKTHST